MRPLVLGSATPTYGKPHYPFETKRIEGYLEDWTIHFEETWTAEYDLVVDAYSVMMPAKPLRVLSLDPVTLAKGDSVVLRYKVDVEIPISVCGRCDAAMQSKSDYLCEACRSQVEQR